MRSEPITPLPWRWFAAALILLTACTIYGAFWYPQLPARYPIHWGADGLPNGYTGKTIGSAFTGTIVGLGLLVVLLAVAWGVTKAPADSPRNGAAAQLATQSFMGIVALIMAVVGCVINASIWVSATNPQFSMPTWALLLLVFIPLALGAWHSLRIYRRELATSPASEHASADSRTTETSDDSLWKAGFFYVNRENPAVLVPKRLGIGWTINFGSTGGKTVTVVLIALIATGIVLPLVLGGNR